MEVRFTQLWVIAFLSINISQATFLVWREMINYSFTTNLPLSLSEKEF